MKPRNKEKKTNEKFRQRIIKSPKKKKKKKKKEKKKKIPQKKKKNPKKKKKKKKTREKITVYKLIVNKLKFSDFSFLIDLNLNKNEELSQLL